MVGVNEKRRLRAVGVGQLDGVRGENWGRGWGWGCRMGHSGAWMKVAEFCAQA